VPIFKNLEQVLLKYQDLKIFKSEEQFKNEESHFPRPNSSLKKSSVDAIACDIKKRL